MISKEYTCPDLEEPKDYFQGIGEIQLPTPTQILFFLRSTTDKLQQEAARTPSHQRFTLLFNLKTKGDVLINHRVFPFHPNQTLLIFPYQFHHFSHFESLKLQWLFCTFDLDHTTILQPLRNQVLDASPSTLRIRNELVDEWRWAVTGSLQAEQVQATLIRLLLAIKQDQLTATRPYRPLDAHDNLLRNINQCMSEWRGRTVMIGDLAEELNMSESRLRTAFKKTAGMTLGDYIKNYRINHSMSLLRTAPHLSLAEIAEEAGFSSPQSFNRAFKRDTGKTPRSYRLGGRVTLVP